MTVVRALPVHAIVERTFPRPSREGDELAKAIGRAIDASLSEIGHAVRSGRRLTVSAMGTLAERRLDEELEAAGERLPPELRESTLEGLRGTVGAYRTSPIFGLARPRTRAIVVNGRSVIFAQPDYWDGARRFYEMKSYRAWPMPPDVALQLRLFQCAFPGFASVLVCFDRHASPVRCAAEIVPPPSTAEVDASLRAAETIVRTHGEEKVLEYLAGPFVAYAVPPLPP